MTDTRLTALNYITRSGSRVPWTPPRMVLADLLDALNQVTRDWQQWEQRYADQAHDYASAGNQEQAEAYEARSRLTQDHRLRIACIIAEASQPRTK